MKAGTELACKDDETLKQLQVDWFDAFDRYGWREAGLDVYETMVWLRLLRNIGSHGLASAFLADVGRPMKLSRKAVRKCVRSLEAKGMLQTIEREKRYAPGVFRLATRPGCYIFGRSVRDEKRPD